MLDGKFLIAEEKYKMIINKKEIVCFGNHSRVYFVKGDKFCSAYKKQGGTKFGTLRNLRKRIGVVDKTIKEIGFYEGEKQ